MENAAPLLDIYWRPGCRFCSAIRTALNEAGIEADWHDIWDDPENAAFVRSVADGNETVPTVQLGDEVLVAPRPSDVVAKVAALHPELAINQRRWPPLRIAQWVTIGLVLVVSNAVARSGQDALSWILDGAAIATYFAFRSVRSRPRQRASVSTTAQSLQARNDQT